MKSIAVFNNKGGVGKTTLLCNLASYLSIKLQKRTLVIDADPQCNASIYLIDFDKHLDDFLGDDPKTIYKIFKPISEGEGYISKEEIPIIPSIGFGTDVIIGDTSISVMEDFLSGDWLGTKNGEPRGIKTTFLLKDLLFKIKDDYDYVFFDVGPSLGAINRVVLMACDFFLIPMSSDIFSLKAIENISSSLTTWTREIEKGLAEYKQKKGDSFKLNEEIIKTNLHFSGYVNQQYTAKKSGGIARPVKAYDQIIQKMPALIEEKLSDFYSGILDDSQLNLGSIPNFNSLIPLSQTANKPIFSLAGADGVVGAHFSKVKEFDNVMNIISSHLLTNIEAYDRLA